MTTINLAKLINTIYSGVSLSQFACLITTKFDDFYLKYPFFD